MATSLAPRCARATTAAAGARGFTFVELTVVIVILGFVAAIVIPRYAAYVRDTRIAALNGLAGAVRMAVETVRIRYMFLSTNTSPVTMTDGTTVAVSTAAARRGIPLSSAGGIGNAVQLGGFTYSTGGANGTFNFVPAINNCRANYAAATGAVTLTTTGC